MRSEFIRSLLESAREDPRINLLVGDLGFGLVEAFAAEFPDRFFNVGVAEQNLAGIAAGMALCGKVVFTYSIANFPTLRCLEQIRNDICYHNASVKIVSVGCGLNYGPLGITHHATEDVAVMRALPGMTIVAPGDPKEAALATRELARSPGPAYLRIGRAGEPVVHKSEEIAFALGRAITVCNGSDLTLIATGTMLHNSVEAAERLGRDGISARVLSMHTVKPLDEEAILRAVRETRMILALEEHSVVGGLGSAIAEVLAESGESDILFKRLGTPNAFVQTVGDQQYLKQIYSLDTDGIARAASAMLERVRVRA